MKRLKTGAFTATVELEIGRSYKFRYLLGLSHWENDSGADDDVSSSYAGSHNSLIRL